MKLKQTIDDKLHGLPSNTRQYAGLASLSALHVPIHETIHGLASVLTGGGWHGVQLDSSMWYLKPLEWLTLGFYKIEDLHKYGAAGLASISHSNSLLGKISGIISTAAPDYVYATLGLFLISHGLGNYKKRPLMGAWESLVGALCLKAPLEYMQASISGYNGDYTGVTSQLLQLFHLPAGAAPALVGLIAVPLIYGAAYLTAGAIIQHTAK